MKAKNIFFILVPVLISINSIASNRCNKIIDVAEKLYCKESCGPDLSCPILCSSLATLVSSANAMRSFFDNTSLIQTGLNFTALFTGIIGINFKRQHRFNSAHYISGLKAPSKKENIFKILSVINSSISLYISCTTQTPDKFSIILNVCNGLLSSMNIAAVGAITMRDLCGNSYPIEKIENNV